MEKNNPAPKRPLDSDKESKMNLAAAKKLQKASRQEIDEVYKMLDSSANGISDEAAKERISTYGLNEVDYDKAPSWYSQLIKSFANPFILILIAIVVISYLIDVRFAAPGKQDWMTVIVIGVMILLSSLLSFFQEYRSNRAAEKLKGMVTTTAAVLRKGKEREEIVMK